MPTCGKAAAITALPQPPNTSQKVPSSSAASFFARGIGRSFRTFRGRYPLAGAGAVSGKVPRAGAWAPSGGGAEPRLARAGAGRDVPGAADAVQLAAGDGLVGGRRVAQREFEPVDGEG